MTTETRPFDAVLCDVDNVIRFYDTTHLRRLERDAGLPEGTTAEVAFSPEIDTPLLRGEISKRQWVDSIAAALSTRVPRQRAYELGTALATAPFRANKAVVAVLRRVSAAIPLVLVSNATVELEDDLASLGLTDLARSVVNSARVSMVKPDTAIYEIAASRAEVAPERCLFVDDSLENVQTAIRLGMAGVHYRDVTDLEEALR